MSKLSVFIIILFFITGCVRAENSLKINVHITQERQTFDLIIPTGGYEFNWHGGGWIKKSERYMLSIPLGEGNYTSQEINLIHPVIKLSSLSNVSYSSCTLTINIFDVDEKEIFANGIYQIKSNITGNECNTPESLH